METIIIGNPEIGTREITIDEYYKMGNERQKAKYEKALLKEEKSNEALKTAAIFIAICFFAGFFLLFIPAII